MTKYAWVTLVTLNDEYIEGAIALCRSIKQSTDQTNPNRPDIVCMVTLGVSDDGITRLEQEFDKVVMVDTLCYATNFYSSAKVTKNYASYAKYIYTKAECFKLTDYTKVMFLDADIIMLHDMSFVFDLDAPASIFYLSQMVKKTPQPGDFKNKKYGSMANWQPNLKTGDKIDYYTLDNVLKGRNMIYRSGKPVEQYFTGTLNSGTMLISPSQELYDNFIKFMDNIEKPITLPHLINGPEEYVIGLYFQTRFEIWTSLSLNVSTTAWGAASTNENEPIYSLSYLGSGKPWRESSNEYPDVQWWKDVRDWKLNEIKPKLTREAIVERYKNYQFKSDQKNGV